MIVRATIVFLLLAFGETLNGVFRVRTLARWVGNKRAKRLALISGSLIILGITWITLPWIGVSTPREAFVVGGWWLLLMIAFDLVIGRIVFRLQWKKILSDFDLRQGNFLVLGMVFLFLAPYLVLMIRSWMA